MSEKTTDRSTRIMYALQPSTHKKTKDLARKKKLTLNETQELLLGTYEQHKKCKL